MTYVGYAGELLFNLRKIAAGKIEVVEFCRTCGADYIAPAIRACRCHNATSGHVLRFQKIDYPLSTAQEVVMLGCTTAIKSRLDRALKAAGMKPTTAMSVPLVTDATGTGNPHPIILPSTTAYHGSCRDDA